MDLVECAEFLQIWYAAYSILKNYENQSFVHTLSFHIFLKQTNQQTNKQTNFFLSILFI